MFLYVLIDFASHFALRYAVLYCTQHDTEGWKALETSMTALRRMIEGCGTAVTFLLPQTATESLTEYHVYSLRARSTASLFPSYLTPYNTPIDSFAKRASLLVQHCSAWRRMKCKTETQRVTHALLVTSLYKNGCICT